MLFRRPDVMSAPAPEAPGTCQHLTCVHMSSPTFVTHVRSEHRGASGETVWLTLI